MTFQTLNKFLSTGTFSVQVVPIHALKAFIMDYLELARFSVTAGGLSMALMRCVRGQGDPVTPNACAMLPCPAIPAGLAPAEHAQAARYRGIQIFSPWQQILREAESARLRLTYAGKHARSDASSRALTSARPASRPEPSPSADVCPMGSASERLDFREQILDRAAYFHALAASIASGRLEILDNDMLVSILQAGADGEELEWWDSDLPENGFSAPAPEVPQLQILDVVPWLERDSSETDGFRPRDTGVSADPQFHRFLDRFRDA